MIVCHDLYSCSVVALRMEGSKAVAAVTCCLLRASSKDEATGKAHRIGEKVYPSGRYPEGFRVLVVNILAEPEDFDESPET